MKIYKISFAEFIKHNCDNKYEFSAMGNIPGTFKSKADAFKVLNRERYRFSKIPYYEDVTLVKINEDEFKIRCVVKNNERFDIHHYKIIEFSI